MRPVASITTRRPPARRRPGAYPNELVSFPIAKSPTGGVDGTGRSWPPWGWTAAEGSRFSTSRPGATPAHSNSTAPPPRPRPHAAIGGARSASSVVTSTRLRGFFWCRGASNRPAGRGQLRRIAGRRPAARRFGTRSGSAGDWQAPTMPAHYARHQLAARGAVAKLRYSAGA